MITLITGGSKNGKSHIAENILSRVSGEKFYIATMEPYCEEAHEAIARHHKMRAGKGFQTIEKYTDIHQVELPKDCGVLLECACNLCANEMFSAQEMNAAEKILEGIRQMSRDCQEVVIVTNQVGEDGNSYAKETMEYIRQMGILNQGLADIADCVIEAVYGIAVVRKGTYV